MEELSTQYIKPSAEFEQELLISKYPFIFKKLKNGKLFCGKCSSFIPAIHPAYLCVDEANEEVLCYPCEYKRRGTSVQEVYAKKRESGDIIKTQRQQKMEQSPAYKIAQELIKKLEPVTIPGRCLIAGSLRRMKPDPKDIELVVLPQLIEQENGLFGDKIVMRSPAFVDAVKSMGLIEKGNPVEGRYVVITLPKGLKLDLFIPQPHDYFRMYAVRTGSKDYSGKVIAHGWRVNGWVGTEDGLRLFEECEEKSKDKWVCISKSPTLPPVWESEEDFFKWLNVPFKSPEQRNI